MVKNKKSTRKKSPKKPKKVKVYKPYVDPLHVPSSELVIHYRGIEGLVLNKNLLDRQNCWENLETIKDLHYCRLMIEDRINLSVLIDNKEEIRFWVEKWTKNQFLLQEAWKFLKDAKFHRPRTIPGCTCPKRDNEISYPSGLLWTSSDCPIHGGVEKIGRFKSFISKILNFFEKSLD